MKKIKSQFLKQTDVGLPLVLELDTQVHYVAAAAIHTALYMACAHVCPSQITRTIGTQKGLS